ncbi:MAG: class I SAM-dependent methyltransferase [Erysipelotrichaceae bacterium]|nr:class I SAM-dependent methyltransferase [Erysipelotrichaceae bacterium]
MITSDSFHDYTLLDAGGEEKLEVWKDVVLCRPDPLAIWPKEKEDLWKKADAVYHRSNKGGGSWEIKKKIKDEWTVQYKELTFKVSPTSFKHTGLFPEQAANWDFIDDKIRHSSLKDIHILNLFAYSGAATMVAAAAGASEVVHVDASKGMITWAKENQELSHLQDKKIRYLVDDCLKFLRREVRRGRKYQGIIMDPPSYGRGPDGEVFKFEEKINPLIEECLKLLADDALFYIINTYTTGYSPTVMENVLRRQMEKTGLKGVITADEIGIRIKDSDTILPCGQTTRWER